MSVRDARQEAFSRWTIGVIRRMTAAIALAVILPVICGLATELAESIFGAYPFRFCVGERAVSFDSVRFFHVLVVPLTVLSALILWRSLVLWTLGRAALTAIVAVVPFAQVIWSAPWWDADCMSNPLQLAQGQLYLGIWPWLMVWAWWGLEKGRIAGQTSMDDERRRIVIGHVRRVASAIGLLPFVTGLFFITGEFVDDFTNVTSPLTLTIAYLVPAGLAFAVWNLIWRSAVRWTRVVWIRTAVLYLLLVMVPIGLTGWAFRFNGFERDLVQVMPLIGWGIWLAMTLWVWPLRNEEITMLLREPACLSCGYLMRGLKSTRCPECGIEPTIDELFAGQGVG